eukprot:jgi/Hompol1/1805/HPOL_000513-RA
MIDFIFGVTHPEHWHSLNLRQNRHHYSALAQLGSGPITSIQDLFGAGLYYNTDVEIDGMRIKYGVIKMDRLLSDLNEWDTLYLAGRLQKPVLILQDDARVRLATQTNLANAVKASLLLLPHRFTEEDLFIQIAGISYRGDFRMVFGENPHKVLNIVTAQMDAFRELYRPIIQELPYVNYLSDGTLEQEDHIKMRGNLIQSLPKKLQDKIKVRHLWYLSRMGTRSVNREQPFFSQSIAESPDLPYYVEKSLSEIVAMPALTQSIKGLFTAGPLRSISYVGEKLSKMLGARKPGNQ